MSKEEKYKKELIDKYLNNNLSIDERHELEKLALDDPFLFEALNGFAQAEKNEGESDHAKVISELQDKILAGPKSKKKRRSMVPYSIAASLLIVFGLSVWLTDFGSDKIEMANTSSTTADDMAVLKDSKDGLFKSESEVMLEEKSEGIIAENQAESVFGQEEYNKIKTKDTRTQENTKKSLNLSEDIEVEPGQVEPFQKTSHPSSAAESSLSVIEPTVSNAKENATQSTDILDSSVVLDKVEMTKDESENDVFDSSIGNTNSSEIASGDESMNEEGVMEAKKSDKLVETPISDRPYATQKYNPEMSDSGLSPFDVHFIGLVKKKLKKREQRALNDNVELQFQVVNSRIIDFKVVPSQGKRIDKMLFDFVQSGSKLLPEEEALLMVYKNMLLTPLSK